LLTCNPLSASTREKLVQPRVIEREPVTLACLRHIGAYGLQIADFWIKDFLPWANEHQLSDKPRYGIGHDDPRIVSPDDCRYDACVEVPADFVVSGDAFIATIPGGPYAVVTFKGHPAHLGTAWASLLTHWLPYSMLHIDARPAFEYYPPGSAYDAASGAFECDLCVPIVPR